MIIDANTQERTQRYRGVSYTRPIVAAKELVPVIDLADRLCGPGQMRKVGERWVAKCPLPGHDERTPSFTVFPDNSWHCFGACQRGGDVVDLAAAAWGHGPGEMGVAAAYLLMEFGHQVPQRPPAWFGRQERQAPARRALEDAGRRRCQRRLYRWLFAPIVARFDDEEERRAEERIAWEEAGKIARLMASQLRGVRS